MCRQTRKTRGATSKDRMISGSPRLFSSRKCKALVAEPSASYIFRGHEFCRQCSTIPTQKAHTPAYAPRSISVVTQFPYFPLLLWWAFSNCSLWCVCEKKFSECIGRGFVGAGYSWAKAKVPVFFFFFLLFVREVSVDSFSGLWAAMKLSVGISYLDLPFLYSDHGLYEIHILRTYWLTHDPLCYCCCCCCRS